MAIFTRGKITIDLVIKRWEVKDTPDQGIIRTDEFIPNMEVLEEKKFYKLSLAQAIKKLVEMLSDSF